MPAITANPKLVLKPVLKPKSTPVTLAAQPDPDALFKAVGIISGEVSFNEQGVASIKIGDNSYRLGYCGLDQGEEIHRLGYKRRNTGVFFALRKYIETTGIAFQRLIVYPRFVHFPGRDRPCQLSFNLVGFVGPKHEEIARSHAEGSVTNKFKDFEFELSGLWQFIPVSKLPVLTVFRNSNEARVRFLEGFTGQEKVQALKAIHIPLKWQNSLVRPFRFNPQGNKEKQGKPPFIQVRTRFVPELNLFEVIESNSMPSASPPKFLKASPKDKVAARKVSNATK
jgi:hypothetical protein